MKAASKADLPAACCRLHMPQLHPISWLGCLLRIWGVNAASHSPQILDSLLEAGRRGG